MTVLQAPGDRAFNWANSLIFLAVALAGIAHLAFLPPFEGFDESKHFSYIQQIADTGQIPRYGVDKVSRDVESYPGPRHYASVPPYDSVGGLSYRSFFNGDNPPSLTPAAPFDYQPGRVLNGEAQQPPLYYALLAPVYLLVKGWSWPSAFLLLRLASWSMAFAGFVIGCRVTQRCLIALNFSPRLCLLAPAWPFLFPEFFPDTARLGNDSLCLLVMGIAWYLLLRLLSQRLTKIAVLLGVMLGLGLLTKAFFVPILAGCACLLIFHGLREGDPRQFRNALAMLVAAGAVGGWWYLHQYLSVGSFIVATDILAAEKQGPIWLQILSNFSVLGLIRGIGQMATSFAWAGTWSYGRFPPVFSLPIIILAALPLFNWGIRLRWAPTPVIAPLFVATPMILGLIYYLLTQIVRGANSSGTPGWYLHILAGPLSLALVVGWRQRLVLAALAVYALGFHVVIWATQLSLFSGCAFKGGDYKYVQFDFASCLIDPSRLSVLAEPLPGALALAAAAALGLTACLFWRRVGAPAKA
jgi:hypothetical protein